MNTQICAGEDVEQALDKRTGAEGPIQPSGMEMERKKARKIDQRSNANRHNTDQIGRIIPENNRKCQTNAGSMFHNQDQKHPAVRKNRPTTRRRRDPSGITDDTPDLRRRSRREYAEMLVAHSVWLPATDRELIEAVFREGLSVAAYVRLSRERGTDLRQNRARLSARTARRRLRRLITRMLSPRFAFVIAQRKSWPPSRRRVAMACVVQGLSLRETAGSLGMSLHAVRRHMDAVDAVYTAYTEQAEHARGSGVWR